MNQRPDEQGALPDPLGPRGRDEVERAKAYADQVCTIAETLRDAHVAAAAVELEWLERRLASADSVGWAVDPTAYRAAMQGRQLDTQRELFAWLTATRAAFERIQVMSLERQARTP